MSRRPRKPLNAQVEALEARQLLSRGGGRHLTAPPMTAPGGAFARLDMAPRPELDAFAADLAHHPLRADRMALGALGRQLALHWRFAARHGWGACLVMELQAHPVYAARHHLTALVSPALPPPPAVPPASPPPAAVSAVSPALPPAPAVPPAVTTTVTPPAATPAAAPTPAPAVTPAGPTVAQAPQSVAVGGTLDVTLPALGLSGSGLTYTITPQPLPANMTFNRGTGELAFAPAPGQAGPYDFTVTVSDGTHAAAEHVPVTVTATPRPSTEVSGQVVDVSGVPLAGVPVMIGASTTTTDLTGHFTLAGVTAQPGPLTVDGYHADAAGDYMMLMAPTTQFVGHPLYAKADNVVPRPIALPHLDLAHATDFSQADPGRPMDLTSPLLPGVSLHVAAHSAMTMDGKPFGGKLALTALPVDRLREVLPPGVVPGSMVGVDGPELMFSTPAQVTLPNTAGYAPGVVLNLLTMNMTTGGFDVTGHLKVSGDGRRLETADGGVLASSCLIEVFLVDGQGLPVTDCNGCQAGANGTAPGANGPAAGGPRARSRFRSAGR